MIFPVKQEHKNPPPKYQGETETFIWKILNKAEINLFFSPIRKNAQF